MVVGYMQSVPITTNVQIPLRRGVLDTTLCDKVCHVTCGRSVIFFTIKSDRHDIIEILLEVALNIKYHNPPPIPNKTFGTALFPNFFPDE